MNAAISLGSTLTSHYFYNSPRQYPNHHTLNLIAIDVGFVFGKSSPIAVLQVNLNLSYKKSALDCALCIFRAIPPNGGYTAQTSIGSQVL